MRGLHSAGYLDDAVQSVVGLPGRGKVAVLDPRHAGAELEGRTAGERSNPLASVTGSPGGEAGEDGVSIANITGILQDRPVQSSVGSHHALHCSVARVGHVVRGWRG